jgi:hypothetical protein
MSWDDPNLKTKLRLALDRFKWGEVAELCEQTVSRIKSESSPMDEKFAKDLLSRLRRKRQFASMIKLAEALVRSGLNTLPVRRQYAQALIDQGVAFTPAEMLLQSVVQEAADNSLDSREARGLIGRIYKQIYVNNNDPASAANRDNLEYSLKTYLDAYRLNPEESWWHGINAVALLERARRDGFSMAGRPDSQQLAKEILAAIQEEEDNRGSLRIWDMATRVEAYVAVGDTDEAVREARRYVDHPEGDAFEFFSTLRQFEEVWQLKETEPPGNLLLPVLRAGHLEKSGAMSKGDPKDLKAEAEALDDNMKHLEAVFGPDRAQTYKWYKLGLDQCNSVARIERRNGRGHGTGWLVNAADFFPGEAGVLLLTNEHVVSNVPNQMAIAPQACQVNFQAMGEVLDVEEKVRWSSRYTELDATFLKLKREPQAPPLVLHGLPVRMNEPPPRMYIIGHPSGRDLELSLQDNYLLACNDSLVHYRTPTEPGSSGSPVFESEAWEVVALHHKGKADMKRIDGQDGFYQANEGISIRKIQSETAKTV